MGTPNATCVSILPNTLWRSSLAALILKSWPYVRKKGEAYGYDEINLNCGCPSDRVQNGRFGACLMKEPEHVAACVEAMNKVVDISGHG